MNCITNMKEKKMSNLSEEIINRYLTGQCSEEELIEVNAWMKESEENARQLFHIKNQNSLRDQLWCDGFP